MAKRLARIQDWETLARTAEYKPSVMAALCMVSLRQMERFFEEQFNQSPREWVLHLKCRIAKQLVMQGYSNKGVVAELRFASNAHFCHQFKKVYGASPQSFAPPYDHEEGGHVALRQ